MAAGPAKYKSQTDDKFMVRMPGDLRARIKSHAKANGQSMTAAVVTALEAAYPAPVEPESINERLLQAALLLAGRYQQALEGMGVNVDDHAALQQFHQVAQEAMNHD